MESEKMAAIKKAYADVITNTARESAERILASERRALRYHQSLFAVKEEALATMIRFKDLMDSKIKEAETTSLNQAKRIQELEAQIKEAECTLRYFRGELERVNNELYKMKNELVEPICEQHATGCSTPDCNGKCRESQLRLSTINPTTTCLSQKNKDTSCYFSENSTHARSLKYLPAEKNCGTDPGLARSKDNPGIYLDRCKQKICALERNNPAGNVLNELSDVCLQDSMGESNVSVERPHTVDSAKTIKIVPQKVQIYSESEGYVPPPGKYRDDHSVKFFSGLSSTRKLRSRGAYTKFNNCTHIQDRRGNKSSDIDNGRIDSAAVLPTKLTSEEPPQKILKTHSAPVSSISCEGEEDNSQSLNCSPSNKVSGLLLCNNAVVPQQYHMIYQNEISQSSTCDTDEHGDIIEGLVLLSTSAMKDRALLTETKQKVEVPLLQVDDPKLKAAHRSENLDVPKIKDDVPVMHAKNETQTACESIEVLPQIKKDKFLKYTFQRTRRRASSVSKNESSCPEKVMTKRKSEDKQNALLELQKPTLVTELPQHSRRLMQVARQLLSLSEKRW